MATTSQGVRTFTAGSALEPYRRVKLSGSTADTVVYAGAGEAHIGTTISRIASGEKGPIRLSNMPGTYKCSAAGAIASANSAVYGAANGQVSTSVSGNPIGLALGTASGANSEIEIMPKLTEAA